VVGGGWQIGMDWGKLGGGGLRGREEGERGGGQGGGWRVESNRGPGYRVVEGSSGGGGGWWTGWQCGLNRHGGSCFGAL